MENRDIMKLVRLIKFLDMSNANNQVKKDEIKFARDCGLITENEAVELTIEFC